MTICTIYVKIIKQRSYFATSRYILFFFLSFSHDHSTITTAAPPPFQLHQTPPQHPSPTTFSLARYRSSLPLDRCLQLSNTTTAVFLLLVFSVPVMAIDIGSSPTMT